MEDLKLQKPGALTDQGRGIKFSRKFGRLSMTNTSDSKKKVKSGHLSKGTEKSGKRG